MRQGVLVIPGAQFMKGSSRKLGFSMVKKKILIFNRQCQEIVKFSHILEKKIIAKVMANKRIIMFSKHTKII